MRRHIALTVMIALAVASALGQQKNDIDSKIAERSAMIDSNNATRVLFKPIRPTQINAKRVLRMNDVDAGTDKLKLMQLDSKTVSPFLVEQHMLPWHQRQDILISHLSPGLILNGSSAASKQSVQKTAVEKIQAAEIDASDVTATEVVVDGSTYEVIVDESTFDELAMMKLEYDFEQEYADGIKASARMKDLKALSKDLYRKWIRVLIENRDCNISKVTSKSRHKLTSEAWLDDGKYTSSKRDTLLKNLDILKNDLGYDAVLVRFDCTESKEDVLAMISDIHSAGMLAYCTYVGKDNLVPRWTPFIEPSELVSWLDAIAKVSDGWLLNWRSTSSHVKLLPREFFNFMCSTLRTANQALPIYGEVYYGRIDQLGKVAMAFTAPKNISGYVISNMGYSGYNHAYVANNMFATVVPDYRKLEKIGQVVGYAPYYASKHKVSMTLQQELQCKKEVEQSFASARCSTVTLLHDGVDDNLTEGISLESGEKYSTCDNLTRDTKLIDFTNNNTKESKDK